MSNSTKLTFICLLLQVGDGVFEVLSTAGDTHLGGDDFDKRIVDFLADDFKKNEGIDLRKDRQVWAYLGSTLLFSFHVNLCDLLAVSFIYRAINGEVLFRRAACALCGMRPSNAKFICLPATCVTCVYAAISQALQRLTEAAEKAKIELSNLASTSISLPFITATADGPKHIDATISRNQFEQLCSDLLDR